MPDILIIGIEAAAAVFFAAALILGIRIFLKTKKNTNIWLLISFAIFIAFLTSGLNALEWYYNESKVLDTLGEYTGIIFSVVWIYIAYRFILFKNLTKM